MKQAVKVNGMVLAATPVGEYDRRVVLLTKELGKISAFARGARRPNSLLIAAARPFSFGTFFLYPGRDSYILQTAQISSYFDGLSNDVKMVTYGFYFLEFADYYAREGIDEGQMLNLLYVTVKALQKPNLDNKLIKVVYEFRMMVINGEYPDLFTCGNCGQPITAGVFSPSELTVYCDECRKRIRGGIEMNAAVTYTLQFIITEPFNHLYTFSVTQEVLSVLEIIADVWKKRFIEKSFHSLEILDTLL